MLSTDLATAFGNRLPVIASYRNPRTDSTSYRVTYYRSGKRIRTNVRTLEEAEHLKERLMKDLLPAGNIQVDNLIRTHLTPAQVRAAEMVYTMFPGLDLVAAARSWRPPAIITLPESTSLFLAEQAARGVRSRTIDNQKSTLAKLLRETGADPAQFADWVQNPAWSVRTRRDRLDLVRHWVGWAVERGHLTADPLVHVPRPMVRNKLPAILTVEQVEALMVAAATDVYEFEREPGEAEGASMIGAMLPWFAICAYSGIRPEEAARLTWDRVNLEKGIVELDPQCTKVGLTRTVHMPVKLTEILAGLRGEGLEVGFYSRRAFRRIRVTAQVPWAIDILRHTYVSHRYAIDPDLNEIARDCGNSVGIIQKHYLRRTVSREDGERYFAL